MNHTHISPPLMFETLETRTLMDAGGAIAGMEIRDVDSTVPADEPPRPAEDGPSSDANGPSLFPVIVTAGVSAASNQPQAMLATPPAAGPSYPQVPLGWRKVTLEWDDGWWMLDFRSTAQTHSHSRSEHEVLLDAELDKFFAEFGNTCEDHYVHGHASTMHAGEIKLPLSSDVAAADVEVDMIEPPTEEQADVRLIDVPPDQPALP